MVTRQNYRKIVARLLPAGTLGVLLLLGSSTPAGARSEPETLQPRAAGQPRIAERLAAVRDAVSGVARPQAAERTGRLAWWAWRNGGGGAWRNGGGAWRNGGWRNGGWGNGGWRNGGWHNGWPNFWRNW